MKTWAYYLIGFVLLATVLVATVLLTEGVSTAPSAQPSQPSLSSDDKEMKSLKIE